MGRKIKPGLTVVAYFFIFLTPVIISYLLLAVLCFQRAHLDGDCKEHVLWSRMSQAEKISVRCL